MGTVTPRRRRWRMPALLATVFAIAFALGALLSQPGGRSRSQPAGVPAAAMLERLERATSWVQHPLDADSLRGRIRVLVLWSDADPRALRVLPEAEAWHRAYGRYGVRVIAVHVPQFAFAADPAIPQRIARALGLTLPLLSDPSYRVSGELGRALDGPEIVIADRGNRVLLRASGAGTAAVDRVLRVATVGDTEFAPRLSGVSAGPATRTVHLGIARVTGGPLALSEPGRTRLFTAQFRFQEEGEAYVPYPVGRWTPGADALVAAREGADNYLSIRGAAGHVWAVIAPPSQHAARVWVLADGQWTPREMAGAELRTDARGASYVDVDGPRLYEIARCPAGCTLRLSPGAPGVAFHAFVFEDLPGR